MEKEREPQLYDTFSKNGVFYRVTSIEDGILTLKRSDGGKQGRPVTGTFEQLKDKGYRLCDIPQVTCYNKEGKTVNELEERIKELEAKIAEMEDIDEKQTRTIARYMEEKKAWEKDKGYEEALIRQRKENKELTKKVVDLQDALIRKNGEVAAYETALTIIAGKGANE